jgi:DNA-binding transcriptional ArsR family regulator
VADVEELKALADPTRLAIIDALMKARPDLRIMSVKELAEETGQPQTKLYRHVRVLESAGLIRVAASRMVSGILEQRYQACQRDLQLAPGFLREHVDETEAIAVAVLDRFRTGFFAAFRAQQQAGASPAASLDSNFAQGEDDQQGNTVLLASYGRLSRSRVGELRAKLQEAVAYFDESASDDPDAVQVNLLIGFYLRPDEAPDASAAGD